MKWIVRSFHVFLISTLLSLVQTIASGSRKSVNTNDVPISVVFVGDINLGDCVKYYVHHGYNNYNDTMVKVAQVIREADIAVGNLESPFVTKTMLRDRFNGNKTVFLDAEPDSVTALQFAGFDVMTLANNHFNDYGEKPVKFSRRILKNVGIESFGLNFGPYDTPQQALIWKKKGIKIGFLGYCEGDFPAGKSQSVFSIRKTYNAGPAIYSDRIAERDVQHLKREGVDVVIIYMHWGSEYVTRRNREQLRIAGYLHSLGVSAVIGSHPHVLQGHRKTTHHLTAYSIGNFLFSQHGTNMKIFRKGNHAKITEKEIADYETRASTGNNPTRLSRILRLQITRNGVIGAKYLPVEIKFDLTNKTLQPTLSNGTHWIDVCSEKDKDCL